VTSDYLYIYANDDNNAEELFLPDDEGRERTTARWLTLQILYEVDSAGHPAGPVIASHLVRYRLRAATQGYTGHLVKGILQRATALDQVIQAFAPDFPIEQIAIIDRNILRIAIFEYSIVQNIPLGAIIHEAVELAAHFGGDAAPRFVNGVLSHMFENRKRLTDMLENALLTDVPVPTDGLEEGAESV
jgi:N utilization substance protein B